MTSAVLCVPQPCTTKRAFKDLPLFTKSKTTSGPHLFHITWLVLKHHLVGFRKKSLSNRPQDFQPALNTRYNIYTIINTRYNIYTFITQQALKEPKLNTKSILLLLKCWMGGAHNCIKNINPNGA